MARKEVPMGKRFPRKGHELLLVAEAEALGRQRKKGEVTLLQPPGTTFTLHCDEGVYLEGEDTAPPPLSFLTSSVAF